MHHDLGGRLLACFVLSAVPGAAWSASQFCGGDIAVELLEERTGHLSAQLQLNGVTTRMLVDTGANVNTLDKTQAKRLGVTVEQGQGLPLGEGRAHAAVQIANSSFGTQPFAVMDLHFINIPSQRYGTEPFAGQLGSSFFKQFRARILYGERVMCLAAAQ